MKQVNPLKSSDLLPEKSILTSEDVDIREQDDTSIYQTPLDAIMPPGFSTEIQSKRSIPSPDIEQVSAIEILFKQLAICAEKLNENKKDKSLSASVCLPQYSYQKSTISKYSAHERMNFFKGHISTMNWALLVQGSLDKVEVNIVPSENLLRYMADDTPILNLTPLISATVSVVDNIAIWQIGKECVPPSSLPRLARRLFSHLLRIACGDIAGPEAPPQIPKLDNRQNTKSLLDSLLQEEELLTWDKCRELEKMINIDLALIDETNFLDHREMGDKIDTSLPAQNNIDLCTDLRSLSEHLGMALRKHSQTRL